MTLEADMPIAASQPMVYRFALFLTGDADAARDISQETMRVALTLAAAPGDAEGLGKWLRAIARNVARQHRRVQHRSWLLVDSEVVAAAEERFVQEGADRDETWEARRAALAGCLGTLGEPARELLRDRYELGRRVMDMARAAGADASAISKRLERVRAALRRCIEKRLKELSRG